MDAILIAGGQQLNGSIEVSGAKNGVLPLMVCSLLTTEKLQLANVPLLTDVQVMLEMLTHYGASTEIDPLSRTLTINSASLARNYLCCPLASKMRASIWLLAPLLLRLGQIKLELPGGDAIGDKNSGVRKIDMHLSLLQQMGAKITTDEKYVYGTLIGKFQATNFKFSSVSVGATINAILACVLAQGESCLENSAIEPEITDMCNCLVSMGANIKGIGTRSIKVIGVKELQGLSHKVIPDRIEAGTYLLMAAITNGSIEICGITPHMLGSLCTKLEQAGCQLSWHYDRVKIISAKCILPTDISTGPFPDFATDLQAQFMSFMSLAQGSCEIVENLYDNRFMHVAELNKMGANIAVSGRKAIIQGVEGLVGTNVYASDIRGSICLVMAALAAEGVTTIHNAYHLSRGYEDLVGKLAKCGVRAEFIKSQSNYVIGSQTV